METTLLQSSLRCTLTSPARRCVAAHAADPTAEAEDTVTPLSLAANNQQMALILRRAVGQSRRQE
jgi:hypothetical protein